MNDKDATETLIDLINNSVEFLDFCESHFSVENVLFHVACDLWTQRSAQACIVPFAGSECTRKVFEKLNLIDPYAMPLDKLLAKIVKLFILPDSPLEINISSKCSDALKKAINYDEATESVTCNVPPATLLRDSQAEVRALLLADVYSRYRRERKRLAWTV